ncbi:uncharacterized protein LOC133835021 [Drosophila sulfurigaster albostrigata]|uniref:uncharacterized protein LOC133835021 n=1 Tax=Drosophila sulfurigaster albostrigata TaxID=89887 RepID=UPI002D21AE2D|nr:uncharacterized protein LOC133835021 [Drosophila sulfurigaster albostrigata]
MLLQTFTLLLLGTSALASLPDATTEALAPSSTSSGGQSQNQSPVPIKEEHFPAVAPADAAEAALIEAQPGLLQPPLPVSPSLDAEDTGRRRLITYDQRQEGQYNIRADLENFMIVLIPPGPQEGLSLLDLLTKSSLRGASKGGSSNKRKHAHAAALKSFYQRQQHQPQQQLQLPQGPISDFIEGRTPYHVDISAVSEEQQQPRLHRQQVDVLPPQLLPMPQLIKPYHLEAEPELIQALPPVVTASSSSSGGNNLLEGYNQMGSHYYRNSRSLGGDSFLDTNRLSATDTGSSSNGRAISVPIYRSDIAQSQVQQHAKSGSGNALYPPIDVPAYIINEAQPRLWQLDDEPTPIQPKHLVDADVLSFELLGLGSDALADSKTLLRDGLARCAPGQRRDSYGACRQVEGY